MRTTAYLIDFQRTDPKRSALTQRADWRKFRGLTLGARLPRQLELEPVQPNGLIQADVAEFGTAGTLEP